MTSIPRHRTAEIINNLHEDLITSIDLLIQELQALSLTEKAATVVDSCPLSPRLNMFGTRITGRKVKPVPVARTVQASKP